MANRRFIDFPIASSVGDNDIILIWQSGLNKQTTKATFLSGLPENLDELNDVTISGLTNGQILRYDSVTGKWENTDQGNLDLNDLNDVSIVSPSNGQVLVYNSSTSKWENSSGGYVPYTGAVTTVNLGAQTIQAGQFVKAGGTAAQFLKADGSVDSTAYGTGSVTSVALTMPSAFNVANSPITTAGTLAVTGAGTVGQYIRGDGSLADFPQASGGGSSVSYYLNGSISQGTIGGVAYKELNKVPILGAGTQFSINADGYIASFLTDAGDPNLLEIAGGNWNFETYFSASSSGGTPTFYVELYKYDGTTFTLIASSSTSPELIAFGTNLNPYFSTLAVPITTLALTDRLAVRFYVTHSGRTITMHTENNTLCQIVTTFTTGLTSLNGLTAQVQNLAVGISGTDFNIASATATHTFNLPTASATNRGALSSADWTTFNNKQNALGYVPVPETRTITINGVSQDLSANRTYNVGTVTSVGLSSATSGVTIGSTPVTTSGTITLAIATASGSQNGLLSSTDWTTFNNKQNALTNPVTGTGTTNYLPKFTGASTIGNSNLINDASGNVGINTANPDTYSFGGNRRFLTVSNTSTNGEGLLQIISSSDGNGNIDFGSSSVLRSRIIGFNNSDLGFFTNSTNSGTGATQKVLITSVGNVGIGVTPSVWGGNYLGLQISATGGFASNGTNGTVLGHNFYYDGTNDRYLTTGAASRVFQFLGGIRFDLAASGSAGNNITFNQAMTLTSGGNLLVGTTTDNGARLQVSGTASFSGIVTAGGGNGPTLGFQLTTTTGTSTPRITNDNVNATVIRTGASGSPVVINNFANSLELVRFTDSGNVGIGAAPNQKLHIAGITKIAPVTPASNAVSTLLLSNDFDNDNSIKHTSDKALAFEVSNGTERMRITSGGSFLVRNTLGDVYDDNITSSVEGFWSNQFSSANGTAKVMLGAAGSSASFLGYTGINSSSKHILTAAVYGLMTSTTAGAETGILTFNTKPSNGVVSNNERMRITSGGNVLIGTTTNNGTRLQVNGGFTVAGTSALADNQLRIRDITDANHAIAYNGTINGPLSYGYFGAGLGWTLGGSPQIALMNYQGNILIGTTSNGSSKLRIVGLPTSSSGLSSGDVWSDSGTLKIA